MLTHFVFAQSRPSAYSLNPGDPEVSPKETAKDRSLATVMRHTREGRSSGKVREEDNVAGEKSFKV